MSDTSVILCFKSVKKYDSLLPKVQDILTEKKLKVMTIKPLPYKSSQKKDVEFRAPDTLKGEDDYFCYYYYYMASDRNPKL